MKNIPPEIAARFDGILKLRDVSVYSRPEYRKWVKYFIDFQSKYPPPEERSAQVRVFSEKLRAKGQTEAQVKQAADAVSLYFAVQKQQVNPLSTLARAVPHPADRCVPEKTIEQTFVHPSAVKEAGGCAIHRAVFSLLLCKKRQE